MDELLAGDMVMICMQLVMVLDVAKEEESKW